MLIYTKNDWQELVTESQKICNQKLPMVIEEYLIKLLVYHTDHPELVTHIFGQEYLAAQQLTGASKRVSLQNIGDACLLFAGFFPNRSERLHVSTDYFVRIGKSAYTELGCMEEARQGIAPDSSIYSALAAQFIPIMDVLLCLHELSSQTPRISREYAKVLYESTGSRYAQKILQGFWD